MLIYSTRCCYLLPTGYVISSPLFFSHLSLCPWHLPFLTGEALAAALPLLFLLPPIVSKAPLTKLMSLITVLQAPDLFPGPFPTPSHGLALLCLANLFPGTGEPAPSPFFNFTTTNYSRPLVTISSEIITQSINYSLPDHTLNNLEICVILASTTWHVRPCQPFISGASTVLETLLRPPNPRQRQFRLPLISRLLDGLYIYPRDTRTRTYSPRACQYTRVYQPRERSPVQLSLKDASVHTDTETLDDGLIRAIPLSPPRLISLLNFIRDNFNR